jgi:YVTN family beta-propeller protein
MKEKIILVFMLILVFSSCNEDAPDNPIKGTTNQGVFIVNEGNFQYSNSSLSYYNPVTQEIENNVFYRANNESDLGDVAQSMYIQDSLGFIVVNNSARVTVININTFKYVGTIDGLSSPRYVHMVSPTKGYITDLYAKAITIFNPSTFEVTGSIPVDNHSGKFFQHPTEQMVPFGKWIFTNCWSFDNKVLVIDTETDQVIDSIVTGIQPISIGIDKNEKLWVLTDGGYQGNPLGYEAPTLCRYDALSKEKEVSFTFALDDNPLDIQFNGAGDTLYFINNHVWKLCVDATEFPSEPFISKQNRLFSALGVDPVTSEVYVSNAIDYLQPGLVYRYSPSGQLIDSFKVGLVPGEFCFKK